MCALAFAKGSKPPNIYYLTNTKTKLVTLLTYEPVYLPPKEKIVV